MSQQQHRSRTTALRLIGPSWRGRLDRAWWNGWLWGALQVGVVVALPPYLAILLWLVFWR